MKENQIVRAYGAAMEGAAALGLAAPQSLLPYSKREIKEAIIAEAKREPDKRRREHLKVGFITFASFVPDDQAKAAFEFKALMDAGEGISSDLIARGDPDAMKLGAAHLRRWAASDQRARAKLWQTINAETGRLMSEWNRRVGK